MGNITGKVWGDTSVVIQNALVELHKINVNAGFKCSEHKHQHKWNGFYVISGTLEIHVRKNDYSLTDVTVLRAGDFTTVRPGEYHWFNCVDDCSALELYYPETLSEDIVRKSVGGKSDQEYKSRCVSNCRPDPLTGKCRLCGESPQTPTATAVYEKVTLTDVDTGIEYNHRAIKGFKDSPCTNICEIDFMTNTCRGCGRTPEEIKAFGLMHMPEGYNK